MLTTLSKIFYKIYLILKHYFSAIKSQTKKYVNHKLKHIIDKKKMFAKFALHLDHLSIGSWIYYRSYPFKLNDNSNTWT